MDKEEKSPEEQKEPPQKQEEPPQKQEEPPRKQEEPPQKQEEPPQKQEEPLQEKAPTENSAENEPQNNSVLVGTIAVVAAVASITGYFYVKRAQ